MYLVIKHGERQTLQLNCKKVVIKITTYKLKSKRAMRLKIKTKGEHPQINQARL
jgi:hypothetical protein